MKKQPTHVWIVEDACWEDVPEGVVGVYARRSDAVKHVRDLRRQYCGGRRQYCGGPVSVFVEDDIPKVRLTDWEVDDEPHCYSLTLLSGSGHYLRAYRREVTR